MMGSKENKEGSLNSIGQVFTPQIIANFMVSNAKFYLFERLSDDNDGNSIKVLEPCSGDGVFLHSLLNAKFMDITAFEIDKTLEKSLLSKYPTVNFHFENIFGSNSSQNYDLIIGNPPYVGQNYNAELFQSYCERYPFCQRYFVGNMDLFYYFIHYGIEHLKPGGILTFITTNYWISKSKKTGIKQLKPHILEECFLLQYIDLTHLTLFQGAKGQHNCIFVLQKKTDQEKSEKIDKKIEIIQVKGTRKSHLTSQELNSQIFRSLIKRVKNPYVQKYLSGITNSQLKAQGNWNLLYPMEVKQQVDEIELYCTVFDKTFTLKDYFLIRNGLIFIKDDLFILKDGKNLKKKDGRFFIEINGEYILIPQQEQDRLKRIYKSKSIISYGIKRDEFVGYAIYFNKESFSALSDKQRNHTIQKRYPVLSSYIDQYKEEFKDILLNAKENPKDLYFPRRGAFIRKQNEHGIKVLFDLENLYDQGDKIFFRYIQDTNEFGFTQDQYYATSDTYFLWSKQSPRKTDYLFFLAYLNSDLVSFLFKAKNIKIKRSKTKLEDDLPVLWLDYFRSERDLFIRTMINVLVSHIISIRSGNKNYKPLKLDEQFFRLKIFQDLGFEEILQEVKKSLNNQNTEIMKAQIDDLLFQLIEINPENIYSLMKKYY